MIVTLPQLPQSTYRNSLFESISRDMTVPLSFKVASLQLQKALGPVIEEMIESASNNRSMILENQYDQDIIDQFVENYNDLTYDDVFAINQKVLKHADKYPSWLQKFLREIKDILQDMDQRFAIPQIDGKIQAQLAKLYDLSQDTIWKKLLRALGKIGKIGGHIATAVYLLLPILDGFYRGFSGNTSRDLTTYFLIAGGSFVLKILVDIGRGKSVLFAVGKNTIFATLSAALSPISLGAGRLAGETVRELAQSVLDYYQQWFPKIEARGSQAAIDTGRSSQAAIDTGRSSQVDIPASDRSSQAAIDTGRSSQVDRSSQDAIDRDWSRPLSSYDEIDWQHSPGVFYTAQGGEPIEDLFDASDYKRFFIKIGQDADVAFDIWKNHNDLGQREFARPGQRFRMRYQQ